MGNTWEIQLVYFGNQTQVNPALFGKPNPSLSKYVYLFIYNIMSSHNYSRQAQKEQTLISIVVPIPWEILYYIVEIKKTCLD